MRNHRISLAIGALMAVVGLALWLLVEDGTVPVVSLPKTGLVLLVLGVVEVLVSGIALALPSTRHHDEPL